MCARASFPPVLFFNRTGFTVAQRDGMGRRGGTVLGVAADAKIRPVFAPSPLLGRRGLEKSLLKPID